MFHSEWVLVEPLSLVLHKLEAVIIMLGKGLIRNFCDRSSLLT